MKCDPDFDPFSFPGVYNLLLAPAAALAQSVTAADIQRLQDEVYQASSEVNRFGRQHRRRRADATTSTTSARR